MQQLTVFVLALLLWVCGRWVNWESYRVIPCTIPSISKKICSCFENCKSDVVRSEPSASTCWLSKISIILSSSTVGSESLKKVFRSLHLHTLSSPGPTPRGFLCKALSLRSPTKSPTSTLKAVEIGFFVESMNRQKTLVEDIVADWNQPTDPGSICGRTLKKSSVRWPYNLSRRCFLAKFDGQVVKMTYIVVGRFMTLDVEVVWKTGLWGFTC